MTEIPDYVARPYPPVHNLPAPSAQWQGMSQDEVDALRRRLVESIIQIVVQTIKGVFFPSGRFGDALEQLREWAEELLDWDNIFDETGVDLPKWLQNLTNILNPINLNEDPILFDRPHAIREFILKILQPTGLVATDDIVRGRFGGTVGEPTPFPMSFPHNFGGAEVTPTPFPMSFPHQFGSGYTLEVETPLTRWFKHAQEFLPPNLEDTLFDLRIAVRQFIDDVLTPANRLGLLDPDTGKLFDHQAPQVVLEILSRTLQALFFWAPNVAATIDDYLDALTAQNGVILSTSSEIARIRAILNPGATASEEFEFTDTNDWGPDWQVHYRSGIGGGNVIVDGHNASWNPSGILPRVAIGRYNGTTPHSATNYQRVTIVYGSAPGWFVGGTEQSGNSVLGRCSDDKQSYVRVRFYGTSLSTRGKLSYIRCVGGNETVMFNTLIDDFPMPTVGTRLTVDFGDAFTSTLRKFTVYINESTVNSFTEDAGISLAGASNLGWGMGMNGGSIDWTLTQALPGKVNQWTGTDQ